MIEIRQAENDLLDDVLLGPLGHKRDLLRRKHAQHCMRLPGMPCEWLDKRTDALERLQKIS